MQPKTFLPEIAVKVQKIDYDHAIIKGITDKGEEITVNIMDKEKKPSKEELIQFIDKKAEKSISQTMVNAIAEKISESEIAENIENSIRKEKPEIVQKPIKFTKELNKRLKEKATEIAKQMYTLKEGMIIKIGGITNENGKVITAKMDFNLSNNKNPGFYILSIANDKKSILFRRVPIKLIPTKEENRYRAVTNSAFTDIEDIKEIFRNYIRTLKAFSEGKINARPGISISFKDKEHPFYKKIEEYNLFVRNENTDYKEIVQKTKEIINEIETKNFFNKIEVFLPLEPVNIDDKILLKESKEKMLRTSFANDLKNKKITKEDIDSIFNKTFQEKKPVFNSFYKLKTDKEKYGFFKESVETNKSFLFSGNYEKIIQKERDFVLNVKKKELNKEKNKEKEKTV